MSDKLKSTNRTEGWHTPMDILVQYVLTVGLGLTVLGYGAWFFFRCQRRRAIADETGLSPAPRVFVPWGDITKVDNTRWKKTGIVTITYRTPAGETQTAELDDYLLDDLPPVLNELATRAEKAEFINPEGDASQTPSPPA